MLDYGCWWFREITANETSLEGKVFYLDEPHANRSNSLVKCFLAAKLLNYQVFALHDGGQCLGSTSVSTFISKNKSLNCLNDGKGGTNSMQVYEIPGNFTNYQVISAIKMVAKNASKAFGIQFVMVLCLPLQ